MPSTGLLQAYKGEEDNDDSIYTYINTLKNIRKCIQSYLIFVTVHKYQDWTQTHGNVHKMFILSTSDYNWQKVKVGPFLKLWGTRSTDICRKLLVYLNVLGVHTLLLHLLPSVLWYHMPYRNKTQLCGEPLWSLGALHLQQLILHHPPYKRIVSCGYQPEIFT